MTRLFTGAQATALPPRRCCAFPSLLAIACCRLIRRAMAPMQMHVSHVVRAVEQFRSEPRTAAARTRSGTIQPDDIAQCALATLAAPNSGASEPSATRLGLPRSRDSWIGETAPTAPRHPRRPPGAGGHGTAPHRDRAAREPALGANYASAVLTRPEPLSARKRERSPQPPSTLSSICRRPRVVAKLHGLEAIGEEPSWSDAHSCSGSWHWPRAMPRVCKRARPKRRAWPGPVPQAEAERASRHRTAPRLIGHRINELPGPSFTIAAGPANSRPARGGDSARSFRAVMGRRGGAAAGPDRRAISDLLAARVRSVLMEPRSSRTSCKAAPIRAPS